MHQIAKLHLKHLGAGRDSDSLLMPLCQYWLERRSDIKPILHTSKDKEEELEVTDQSQTPPPPRCPTAWTVRKADSEAISTFQEQERRRYANPHKSFTYRCNGYESVVGPVKGTVNAHSTVKFNRGTTNGKC